MQLVAVVKTNADRDAVRAVLHVDPVVVMIPDTLDAQVVSAVKCVSKSSQWFNEEALGDFTLSGQHQHPRVNAQSIQTVFVRQFQLLTATLTGSVVTVAAAAAARVYW